MRLTDNELKKLQAKALDFRQEPVRRMKNIERMAKLLMRRHKLDPEQHKINIDTGDIEGMGVKE